MSDQVGNQNVGFLMTLLITNILTTWLVTPVRIEKSMSAESGMSPLYGSLRKTRVERSRNTFTLTVACPVRGGCPLSIART